MSRIARLGPDSGRVQGAFQRKIKPTGVMEEEQHEKNWFVGPWRITIITSLLNAESELSKGIDTDMYLREKCRETREYVYVVALNIYITRIYSSKYKRCIFVHTIRTKSLLINRVVASFSVHHWGARPVPLLRSLHFLHPVHEHRPAV
jgi:hypothetical protein